MCLCILILQLFLLLFDSGVKTTASGVSNDLNKGNKKAAGGEGAEEEIHYTKAAPALSVTVASENGGSTHFVRVSNRFSSRLLWIL